MPIVRAALAASSEVDDDVSRVPADKVPVPQPSQVSSAREFVSAKDCDKWVADQLARHAARKADEGRRREEWHADEDARSAACRPADGRRQYEQHMPAGTLMIPAELPDTTANMQHSGQANAAEEMVRWSDGSYEGEADGNGTIGSPESQSPMARKVQDNDGALRGARCAGP